MDKSWTWNTARAALLGSLVALGGSAGAVATAAEPAAPVPIGINESRCTGEVCSVGACVTQRLFDATSLPSTVRIVPNLVAGKPHGFKLYAIRPGSLPAHLGLLNGDTVVSINGKEFDIQQLSPDAIMSLKAAPELTLGLERKGLPFTRRVHLDHRPLTDSECPAPVAPPPPAATAAQPPVSVEEAQRSLAQGIVCLQDRCTVTASVFDSVLGNQALLLRSGRFVPTLKDGKPVGLRLMGVRAGSLLELLGLRNGDLLQSLEQRGEPASAAPHKQSLATPQEALAAGAALHKGSEFNLTLERQGGPLTRTYLILR